MKRMIIEAIRIEVEIVYETEEQLKRIRETIIGDFKRAISYSDIPLVDGDPRGYKIAMKGGHET